MKRNKDVSKNISLWEALHTNEGKTITSLFPTNKSSQSQSQCLWKWSLTLKKYKSLKKIGNLCKTYHTSEGKSHFSFSSCTYFLHIHVHLRDIATSAAKTLVPKCFLVAKKLWCEPLLLAARPCLSPGNPTTWILKCPSQTLWSKILWGAQR